MIMCYVFRKINKYYIMEKQMNDISNNVINSTVIECGLYSELHKR